ncbi:MAG: segregation/condensation protein A [Fibrobacteraceae bacterium]|nr:segregation/condensation protein A [Fibrobacteraceae bacterium]
MSALLQNDYEVRIGAFEGPMDLLLYLVQKNEVKPEAISIAEITNQYLEWIKDLSKTDLSAAGDFLLMASRLMELKVRELLPKDEQSPDELLEFYEDREAFLLQIQEYQRYKQVAKELQDKERENFGAFYRGRPEKMFSEDDTLADANIWQLFRAYQKSLKTGTVEHIHHIELDYVTIEDRQQVISNHLALHGRALFEELLGNDPHPILATVTFMALMEMIKTDEVVFRQGEPLGPIWIYRKKNNMQYADEMANEAFYLSPDPPVDPELLEIVRKREEHLALQKNATIDAVMREVVLWATSGKIVKEEDIMAMLEGKVALSENEPEKNESESSEINKSQTEISENEPTLEPTLEQTEPAEKS